MLFAEFCPVCDARGPAPCSSCIAAFAAPPLIAHPAGLDGFFALASYEGGVRRLVHRLKGSNRRGSLRWASAALAERSGRLSYDVVCWVPSSAAGRRARGYEPGRLLAQQLARHLQVPCRSMLVRRAGEEQTGHSRARRLYGPTLRARRAAPPVVLVVDDVSTTGASLSAAAVALRTAGALHVYGAVIARTP